MYSRFTDEYYPKIAIESSFHYRYDVSSNEFLDGFLEHTLGKLPSREDLHSKWYEETVFVGLYLLTSLTYSVALLDAENAPKPKKSQMQIPDGLKTLAFGKKGKN